LSNSPTPQQAVRASPIDLLKIRNFRKVWLTGALAGLMRWFDVLAFSVYVLNTTGSAFMVAVILFFRLLPMLLFGVFIGAYAETVDRKKLLSGCLITLSIVYFVLFYLAWSGALQYWHLAVGIFMSGIYSALEMPVRRTMIAEIGGIERIATTMGLDSTTFNLTRMIGPFLAGFVFEEFGIEGTLLVGVSTFFIASMMLRGVEYETRIQSDTRPSLIQNVLEGLSYARQNNIIMAILAVTIVMNLVGFSFVSMLPVIAKDVLDLSAFPTGILMSGEGVGALLGSLSIAFFATNKRSLQMFYWGAVSYMSCVLVFTFSTFYEVSFILLFLAGFGVSGFAAMQSALIIKHSPQEMRNRLMGVLAMCIGFGPLGVLIIGYLAEQFGAISAVQITGSICIICLVYCGFKWSVMLKKQS